MVSPAANTSFAYDYTAQSIQSKDTDDTSFSDTLASASKKSKLELENEKCAAQIKALFDDINRHGGALGYVIKSNLDKIQKLIEEKKQELQDKLGLNSNPPLTGDKLEQAQDALEKELDAYKKELMEKLEAQRKLDKSTKNSTYIVKLLGEA